MKNFKKIAFTLVEVMIALVIFSLVLESIYVTLKIGQRSWTNYSENVLVKQEVRRALSAMVNELREAEGLFITKDEHSIRLSFQRPLMGEVSYEWSDIGENAFKIMRKNYSQERLLANNISFLLFTSGENNAIMVDVAGGGDHQFLLQEEIVLRSKTSLIMQGQNEKIK